jgi:hypothetical protein
MINFSIDPQDMKNAVRGLINQLATKIDKDYLRAVCKERYGIENINGIEHKDGDVVVIKDEVACKVDFEVRFPMSVYITNGKNPTSAASQEVSEGAEFEDIDFEDLDENA